MLLYGFEARTSPNWFQVEAQIMLKATVHHGYHPGHNPEDVLCVSPWHCYAGERTYTATSASGLCFAEGIKPKHFKEPEASVLISSEETSRPLSSEPG